MSLPGERGFQPPAPHGEPYRADPSDPAPFLTEHDKVPVVPVEREVPTEAMLGYGQPPTHSNPQQTGPTFTQPGTSKTQGQAPPSTPNERFARNAFWAGIASIFVFNVVLGPIAIIMGTLAIVRGEKRLGQLAILFGVIGTVIGVALLVLVAEGVIPSFDQLLRDVRNGN